MLQLVPNLKTEGFEGWLRALQGVAAQFEWYDFESADVEWTPLQFDNSDKATKRQRMTAYTVITKTAKDYAYLYQNVSIGDAKGAYQKICSLLNRTTVGGFIEASAKLYESSMSKDKLTAGEFAAKIAERAKLVRKRGGNVDDKTMVFLLLKGLLPEFKHFKENVLASDSSTLTFDELTAKLHDYATTQGLVNLRHGGNQTILAEKPNIP